MSLHTIQNSVGNVERYFSGNIVQNGRISLKIQVWNEKVEDTILIDGKTQLLLSEIRTPVNTKHRSSAIWKADQRQNVGLTLEGPDSFSTPNHNITWVTVR